MQEKGEIGDFTYTIDDENVVRVFHNGKPVWTSRAFRLHVQAVAQAKEYILKASGTEPKGDVTLVVQKLSVDPRSLFGGKRNG